MILGVVSPGSWTVRDYGISRELSGRFIGGTTLETRTSWMTIGDIAGESRLKHIKPGTEDFKKARLSFRANKRTITRRLIESGYAKILPGRRHYVVPTDKAIDDGVARYTDDKQRRYSFNATAVKQLLKAEGDTIAHVPKTKQKKKPSRAQRRAARQSDPCRRGPRALCVAINGHVAAETADAVCFDIRGRDHWVPKSALYLIKYADGSESSEVRCNCDVESIQCAGWIAYKKRMAIIG